MNISLEMIDQMRKRTNCSYEEAKTLLEKYNGNIVEAIVEFERSHNVNIPHGGYYHQYQKPHGKSLGDMLSSLYKKGCNTRVVVESKEKGTIINLPIIFFALVLPALWIVFIGLGLCFILGYKIRIKKMQGEEVNINKIFNSVTNSVKNAAGANNNQQPQQNSQGNDVNKDGYGEYTIE